MFFRLVRFAGHTCAVASVTVIILVTSVHTASSDRPLSRISSFSQSLASRVVGLFERTVFAPIKERLPRPEQEQVVAHFENAFSTKALVPPTILRVIVESGGHATLSGVATPGSKVAIQSSDRALGQTRATPSGHWHVRLPQALAQGDHRIRSVAVATDRDQQWPGQEVRIALPQTLTRPLVVLEVAGASELVATPAIHTLDTQALETKKALHWRLVQADVREDRVDGRDRRQYQKDRDNWIAAPLFGWLRRSSVAYDQWIVDDLSGGDSGFNYVLRGRDGDVEGDHQRSARARRDNDFDDSPTREYARRNLLGDLGERWQVINVRVREWLHQAKQSYRNNIVEGLADGDRVSRDRFVRRAEPDRETSGETRPERDDGDWALPHEVPDRTVESVPEPLDVESNWPVVRDDKNDRGAAPDPENEALIRKAQEDARKARELARKAAEQAEATRKATEELLAQEKRLELDGSARRAAAEKAVREAELKRQVEAAEKRAAAAEAKLKDKDTEALAKEYEAQETEARARADAQRKTAEDLAAAASAAADQEFAAGRVQELPVPEDQDTKISETDRARQPTAREEFTVADRGIGRRLSIKDSAADAQIEEGSTFGDVDDFDPSVRYVYDMGDGVRPKAKSKRRYAKKRRARSRKAKRKSRYRKHVRKRRTYRNRRARLRRARYQRRVRYQRRARYQRRVRYQRRARLRRVSRRLHRHVRRFGRLYKFKAARRIRYRRQAYARTIFIPRIRWRRR